MGTILTIVVIILLGAALPTFPYSTRYAARQSASATRNGNPVSPHVQTSRVRRTWSDRLKLWQRAFETKI